MTTLPPLKQKFRLFKLFKLQLRNLQLFKLSIPELRGWGITQFTPPPLNTRLNKIMYLLVSLAKQSFPGQFILIRHPVFEIIKSHLSFLGPSQVLHFLHLQVSVLVQLCRYSFCIYTLAELRTFQRNAQGMKFPCFNLYFVLNLQVG